MYRNIVFDMGGVLLDYHPLAACRHFCPDEAGAQKLYRALFASPEWIRLDGGTLTEAELLPILQERLEGDGLSALAGPLLDHWHEYSLSPIAHMGEMIRELKDAGLRVFLLSNAGVRLRAYQQLIPEIDRFDGLLVSAEEKLLKPDPAIYRRLCERFGLTPEECFFIDDVPANVEGAKAVGLGGVVFDGDAEALRRALWAALAR